MIKFIGEVLVFAIGTALSYFILIPFLLGG